MTLRLLAYLSTDLSQALFPTIRTMHNAKVLPTLARNLTNLCGCEFIWTIRPLSCLWVMETWF
jgi:hypothetical protein